MSDIITETLEDGTPYQIDMDLCDEKACEVLDFLYELDGNLEDFDFTTAVFSLFINSIHILLNCGWKPDELMREVKDHSVLDSGSTLQ